jgi:hypothetical protein
VSDEFSYSVLCVGDAEFIRTAAIPLGQELEDVLGQQGRGKDEWPDAPPLGVSPEPGMDLWLPELLGVLLFLGSWTARKLLDELYATKLQPHVKRWLAKADRKVRRRRKGEPTFSISLWYEDLNIVVVVVLKGESYAALADASELALSVHREGLEWALNHPDDGPVFLYVVAGDSPRTLPSAFQTVGEAMRSVHT